MIQGRYLIIQMIGKGGMGEVYLAVDQRLGSAIALKRTFFAGDEMLGNAFEREARILARMRHPVLPKVSDHFAEGDEQFLVMEHISGDDLSKRLEVAQKPFPLTWVMFWADQLLDALSYLHSHEPPIIHRDIKPQNLKLTDENHIILLDFGLSKSSTGNTVASAGSGSSGSTASVVGYTPHYAPMEQIRGIGTNPRSDLYSLSATLYQLLTNTVPPDALSRADSLINGEDDPIKPLNEINNELPKAVSDVILKAMEISQEKRYETAKEMQKALRRAYASMQNAMTAQTIAFNVNEQQADIAANDPIAPNMDKTEVMQFGVQEPVPQEVSATIVPDPLPAAEQVPDLDATIAFDPSAFESQPKQADLKTEVFNAGSIPSSPYTSDEQESFSEPEQPAYQNTYGGEDDLIDLGNDYSTSETNTGEQSFSPDATMPMIAFQQPQNETFSSDANQGYTADNFGGEDYLIDDDDDEIPKYEPLSEASMAAAAPVSQSVAAPQAVAAAPEKKKGSGGKIAAIFGGLLLLFVVAAAAVGGGYYYLNVYNANVVADPTPTPTPLPTPTPEPTIESSFDSNVNTNSNSNSNSNSNTDTNTNLSESNTGMTVAPTPSNDGETRPRQPQTRPTPRTAPARTPAPPKPTPAPTRNRTIILQ